MTDRERLLEHLIEHGSITTYEARILEISGNPSERCRELIAAGHKIDIEHGYRISRGRKRPCARYTLVALASETPERVAGGGDANGGTSQSGSDITSSSPEPVALFEVPEDHGGYIDVDQRAA